MKENFTIEDLELAFEAGQRQANAEWNNDTTSTIGYYNSDAEMHFYSWLKETFKNEEL